MKGYSYPGISPVKQDKTRTSNVVVPKISEAQHKLAATTFSGMDLDDRGQTNYSLTRPGSNERKSFDHDIEYHERSFIQEYDKAAKHFDKVSKFAPQSGDKKRRETYISEKTKHHTDQLRRLYR